MSDVKAGTIDPSAALQRARVACSAFSSLGPSSSSPETAAQLCASVRELLQIAEQLLAEKEQFRSRLHRSTTFSIPENFKSVSGVVTVRPKPAPLDEMLFGENFF